MNGCFLVDFGDACARASPKYSPILPYDVGSFLFGRSISAFRRIWGEGLPFLEAAKNSCRFRCCSSRVLREVSCSRYEFDRIFLIFRLCSFNNSLRSIFFAALGLVNRNVETHCVSKWMRTQEWNKEREQMEREGMCWGGENTQRKKKDFCCKKKEGGKVRRNRLK